MIDSPRIYAFAQDTSAIAWIGGSYAVHVRSLRSGRSGVVGSAGPYGPARPALALAGTHAIWSNLQGGNAPYTGLWLSALGRKKAAPIDLFMGGSGDPGGIFLSGLAGDGRTLLYGKTFEGCSPPPWPPGPCPTLEATGGVSLVTGYYEGASVRGTAAPAMLAFTGHDPSGGRSSQGLVAVAPAASPVLTDLDKVPRVAENAPVHVYRLFYDAVLVHTVTPQGTVRALALGAGRLAVLVQRADGAKAIERYDVGSGRRIGTIAVPRATAAELGISGSGVLYHAGSRIYLLTAGTPRLVWRAGGTPIGLSIEGRRIAWAVNGRGRGRIVALTVGGS